MPVSDGLQMVASDLQRTFPLTVFHSPWFEPGSGSRQGLELEPAMTPQETVENLAASVRGALGASDVQTRFAQLGLETLAMPYSQCRTAVKSDCEKWGAIIEAFDFSLE